MSQTYQSRIFSFISSRTNQLKDTCAKGWRHLKVSVLWSGQILLHPLQILAQASKILKPQLPPSPQPTPDINIEEALYLIETAGYSIKIAISEPIDADKPKFDTALSTSQSPQSLGLFGHPETTQPGSSESSLTYQQPQPTRSNFRARVLASLSKGTEIFTFDHLPDDRSLVDNRQLDPTQFVGVASPLENRTDDPRINYTPSKPTIRGLSSRLSDRQIVLVSTDNELLDTLTIAQQQQIRHRIGIDLATAWEQWQTSRLVQPVVSVAESRQTTRTLPNRPQSLLTSETNLPTESLFDRFNNWLYNFSHAPESSPTPIELPIPRKDPLRLQQLQPAPHIPPFVDRIRQQAQWLDLPQLPPISEIDRELQPAAQIIPSTTSFLTKLQPNWLKQWVDYYQDYLHIPNDSQELVKSVEEFKLTPIEPKYDIMKLDSKIRQAPFNGISAKSQRNNIEYYPDWIDTTAEEMGYSSSRLSRVLMLLDRIAVKIENWLIGIWKLLQRLSNPET
jgi:hypothetical protein